MIINLKPFRFPFTPTVTMRKISHYEGFGGFDKDDPGGHTRGGVIFDTFKTAVAQGVLPRFGGIPISSLTTRDLYSLTQEEILLIFEGLFVNPLHIGGASHPIGEIIVDYAWGSGLSTIPGLLGKVKLRTSDLSNLNLDHYDLKYLVSIFLQLTYWRYVGYMSLTSGNLPKYRPGWIARCNSNTISNLTNEFNYYGTRYTVFE